MVGSDESEEQMEIRRQRCSVCRRFSCKEDMKEVAGRIAGIDIFNTKEALLQKQQGGGGQQGRLTDVKSEVEDQIKMCIGRPRTFAFFAMKTLVQGMTDKKPKTSEDLVELLKVADGRV
mmetsp:Transcript_21318/g.29862  ORF Transcript_21318/g.29862 Transcript_21318/m.29862 type:complete len:119 (+) Transcript_21318:144-500(+)|eukprot:CAMPEP_0184503606 /NCGR_PEP_ID=MMETSP0113_2-20130426/51994_1 /TAXON_ID=91329 /ORGANISM="Norrisiella sphaerica, Strain BC52" /LENGTH=118 /DNA_ID=CAMNT_0026893139 /DNA_START=148 /DNA_END=504 /DNA_ORIENTATION=-